MGSYGIGISRLVAALIEAKFNNSIMKWPISVSPFDVAIIPMINKSDHSNLNKAEKIYNELKEKNIDVLLDDTEENISAKIKKFNLLGIPNQIIIGQKYKGDLLEYKEIDKESQSLNINQIIQELIKKKNYI